MSGQQAHRFKHLLDFVTCLFLSTSYLAKLSDVRLEGTRGHLLCLTLLGEGSSWGPFNGSLVNLSADVWVDWADTLGQLCVCCLDTT